MKNKQRKLKSTISVSELILSAVYFLQKKNGVTAKDITKYICSKRGFKQSQMKNKVKEALDRGIRNGIFNMKRGLYKVDEECKKKLTSLKKKVKKKAVINKIPKKIMQKKASLTKDVAEEKNLTPAKETPKKSAILGDRGKSHSLSEDIFDRRGRENSYFEPSALARPSDEEYDDFDDDDYDNEDDESSECDERNNLDIFTITCREEASHEKFPELDIYTAARQSGEKETSAGEKKRNKSSNRGKGRKRKRTKACKKKIRENEKKKLKGLETDDDDDDEDDHRHHKHKQDDEDESEYTADSDHYEPKKKTLEGKTQLDRSKKGDDKKERKESREVRESKTGGRQKSKSAQGGKKNKKSKRESSEENIVEKSEGKREKSSSKSDCMLTSSTKLLDSNLKLSISPNMVVSDVKFSPTSMKFEAQNPSMLLISDFVKNDPADRPVKDEEFLEDFEILCECQPPKRQHLNSCDPAEVSEPNQNQSKTKWSKK